GRDATKAGARPRLPPRQCGADRHARGGGRPRSPVALPPDKKLRRGLRGSSPRLPPKPPPRLRRPPDRRGGGAGDGDRRTVGLRVAERLQPRLPAEVRSAPE